MAGLKDRVLALVGRRRKGPGPAGWVRLDADNVIRGWVADPNAPLRRLSVEVRIDGEVVGSAVADRFDAKLLELGHGDGRHAFEVLVPARFRDGAKRSFEAVTSDGDYRLMSRSDALSIPPSALAPTLVISRVGVEGVVGALSGGQYPADAPFEVWSGGARLAGTATSWRPRGPRAEFQLTWPAGTLFNLAPDAEIAAPGMYEASAGAGVFAAARLLPQLTADGLTVTLQGALSFNEDARARVRLIGANGAVGAEAALRDGVAVFSPAPPIPAQARLQLLAHDQSLPGLDTSAEPRLASMVRNGEFRSWRDGQPTHWSLGEGVRASRGFYAFPDAAAAAGALSGDTAGLEVTAPGGRLLIAQDLKDVSLPRGAEGAVRLVARASGSVTLELDLRGADGAVVQSLSVEAGEAWAWTVAHAGLADQTQVITRVELSLAEMVDGDLTVEVASIVVGGIEDPEATAQETGWGLPENLVENGALLDWPNGLLIEGGAGRSECARGWFVQNRKAREPVRVMASSIAGGFGMAAAASEVADYCRLEARLHPQALRAGPRLRVAFEAQIPTHAPQAFQTAQPFVVVERLFLMRRGRKPTQTGFALSLEVIGTFARRIVIGRDPQGYSFDLDVAAVGPGALEAAELFLAFDFNNAFSVLLANVTLSAAVGEAADTGGLSLEDPAITVQAATLKGLSAWLSPEPVQPGLRFEPAGDPATPALRWSPTARASASVEVVICIHDAADDALACLASLVGGSSLPHTVQIIDDASGADTRARLLAFIADKPWMRMTSNARNLGYTASANLGIRASAAEWVILLNSDTVVCPGWIEGMLECAASDAAIAFVGPVSNAGSYQSAPELKDRQGRWKVNMLPPGWSACRMAAFVAEQADKGFPSVPLLNGFCTMIRREAFLALGGLNEAAFPQGYGEENDLCVRATAAGYRLAVADHVYVYHAKSASFGSARRAELQKAAGKALAALHPDVDFTALGDRFREAAPLVNLRARVRALYEAQA